MSSKTAIRVGITMGDPSGIGPAIILNALARLKSLCNFVIIGDAWVLKKLQNRNNLSSINIVDLNNIKCQGFAFGRISKYYGRASVEYLDQAVRMLKMKEINALVTCPISKEAVHLAGFGFVGHTEYLASSFGIKKFEMMMLNKDLKVVVLTRHIPLRSVAASLTIKQVHDTVIFVHDQVRRFFGIRNPRLAVCGLNPHASDNGVIGDEENRIIKPALKNLKGIDIQGPIPADVLMQKAMQGFYDCVIAMYHDQALIPLKLAGDYSGVNITLGLPFVRTSPLHGTAFDIAGSLKSADCGSLIEAVKLAIRCSLNLRKD